MSLCCVPAAGWQCYQKELRKIHFLKKTDELARARKAQEKGDIGENVQNYAWLNQQVYNHQEALTEIKTGLFGVKTVWWSDIMLCLLCDL